MLFFYWLCLQVALMITRHLSVSSHVASAYRSMKYCYSDIATILLWYAAPFSWLILRSESDIPFVMLGLPLTIAGNALSTWAMRSNPYCRPEIVTPPKVVRSGAYLIFNHPMYVGCVLQGIGSLLFLNNLLGVAPLAVYAAILWRRARREDEIIFSIIRGS